MIRQDWSTLKKLMFMKTAAGGEAAVEATATGNPLTFLTDLARPLKSLLIPFTPVQSGTGDPSPENIRSILPWNGLTVFGGGKNLLEPIFEDGRLSTTGQPEDYPLFKRSKNFVPIKGNTLYLLAMGGSYRRIYWYDKEKNFISSNTSGTPEKTAPENSCFAKVSFPKEDNPNPENTIALNYPATESAYVPYHQITDTDIVFPSPVYGGQHEAVSGKLMDGWKAFDLGKLSWNVQNNGNNYYFVAILPSSVYLNMWTPGQIPEANNYPPHFVSDRFKTVAGSKIPTGNSGDNCVGMDWISEIRIRCDTYNHDASAFKTAMDGVMMYYELATPQEIQLTPTQITALIGNNTIWSDADGSMTATYLKKG